jgi:hypothetical protein
MECNQMLQEAREQLHNFERTPTRVPSLLNLTMGTIMGPVMRDLRRIMNDTKLFYASMRRMIIANAQNRTFRNAFHNLSVVILMMSRDNSYWMNYWLGIMDD